jgi:hypothetical protein
MPENNHSETETAPPHAQLVQMAMAYWTSRIVYVAAKLGLADHLAKGPGDTPHPGKMLDMMMLVGPGGQERTEQEYGTLLSKAGLRLTRVVLTESPVSVVEAGLA